MSKNIGIIGNGFVGSAVEFGFSAQTNCDAVVRVYDKNPVKSVHTLNETVLCTFVTLLHFTVIYFDCRLEV